MIESSCESGCWARVPDPGASQRTPPRVRREIADSRIRCFIGPRTAGRRETWRASGIIAIKEDATALLPCLVRTLEQERTGTGNRRQETGDRAGPGSRD